jgi:prefoldin subunit 5
MTIQPTDIALVVISLVACTYCFLLGRRLKALQNNKDGLGATIKAFTRATAEISAATQQTCQRAGQQATVLSNLIKDAETVCSKLKITAAETEHRLSSAAQASEDASRKIEDHLEGILSDAREQNAELTKLTEQMRVLSSQTTDAIRTALTQSVNSAPESVFLKQQAKKQANANVRPKQ